MSTFLETDILIIGSGIIGLSLAREIESHWPGVRIILLEKENELGFHASGRNSGVLHAGFYYASDSLKARLTAQGNQLMANYCLENGLPLDPCGKVVVAQNPGEISVLAELKARGDSNGSVTKLVDEQELHEIEPNANTVTKALFSPNTATVDPKSILDCLVSNFNKTTRILLGEKFIKKQKRVAITTNHQIAFKHAINAAGLYADHIARHFGAGHNVTLIPFKGLYREYQNPLLLKRHVYPVPNLKNPFLGVHFTRTVKGQIKVGPTAIPAFWREQYKGWSRFSWVESAEIIGQEAKLFIANKNGFRDLSLSEMKKYRTKYFTSQASNLVKKIDTSHFGKVLKSGIRAQLINKRTKELVSDFLIEEGDDSTHVLNAVSPGLTCAFSFARFIVINHQHHIGALL